MNTITSLKRRANAVDLPQSDEPPHKISKLNPLPLAMNDLGQGTTEGNSNRETSLNSGFIVPLAARQVTVLLNASIEYKPSVELKRTIFKYVGGAAERNKATLEKDITALINDLYATFVPCESLNLRLINPPLDKNIIKLLNQLYKSQRNSLQADCTLNIREGQLQELEKIIHEMTTAIVYARSNPSETALHSLFRTVSFEQILNNTMEMDTCTQTLIHFKENALALEEVRALCQQALQAIQDQAFLEILTQYLKQQSKGSEQNLRHNTTQCLKALRHYCEQKWLQPHAQDAKKYSYMAAMQKSLLQNLENFLPKDWDSISLSLEQQVVTIHSEEAINWGHLLTETTSDCIQDLQVKTLQHLRNSLESFSKKRIDALTYADQLIALLQKKSEEYHTAVEARLQAIEDVLEVVSKLSEKLYHESEATDIGLNAVNENEQTALDILSENLEVSIEVLAPENKGKFSEAMQRKAQGYFVRCIRCLDLLHKAGAFSENGKTVFDTVTRQQLLNLLHCVPNLEKYDGFMGFLYNCSFNADIALEDTDASDLYTTDISYIENRENTGNIEAYGNQPEASQLERELYAHLKQVDSDAASQLLEGQDIFLEHRQIVLGFLSGKQNIADCDRLLSYIYFYLPLVKKDAPSGSEEEENF